MATSDTSRIPRRPTACLLISLLGILAVLICGGAGAPIYNIVRGEHIARGLMPPDYPGSTLIEVEQERFPNTRFEYRTYHTPDSVETVLAYMEQHMPGFSQRSSERYDNQRRDNSLPSLITARLVRVADIESGVPSVEVKLDDANTTGTEITIILSWPDP